MTATFTTFISSRLTPAGRWTSSDGRATAEVALTGETDDRGAARHEWTLTLDGARLARQADMTGFESSLLEMLGTLASFLSAWQEAQRYESSENRDTFPASCLPWLDYIDELESDTYADDGGE